MSRYYAEDAGGGPDPGYPVLAVSDPAADVTSTQTWRAIAEGRSTGIWAAPAGLRAPAGNAAMARQPTGTRSGSHTAPRSGPNTGPETAPRSGPHSGPQAAPRSWRGEKPEPTRSPGTADPDASPNPGRRAGGGRRRPGARMASPGRRRPVSVHLSMIVALVLVLAAATTLGYFVIHMVKSHPRPTALSRARTSTSASPSPSLGPYGDIATRQGDPQPLTVAQLYPPSYTDNGTTVTSTASSLSSDCSGAITGAPLQTAVSWAGCNQVVRATYLSASQGLMGTIGVLNLTTAAKAKTAVQSADASDFISQLAGSGGPTAKIGQGTGIEQAAAKGHYVILIWAQLTSLGKPNAAQTTALESFMTGLLQNTANVSLSTRLLTGAP